jgi:hypothetical protein
MGSPYKPPWTHPRVPIQNLLDLFLYICRDLNSDYEKKRNSYRLELGSLTVILDVAVDKFDFHEVIAIRKKWNATGGESVVYTMDYMEPHIFQAHEKERIKSDPKEDWIYQAHLKSGKNRYLSKEMFVDNLSITGPSDCGLEYLTDDLGRSLRTLSNLKLSADKTPYGANKDVLFHVYEEMLVAAEDQLLRQLGQDKTKWKAALRRGQADIPVPFRHRVDRVHDPWFHGRELVRLCRFFAKTEIN